MNTKRYIWLIAFLGIMVNACKKSFLNVNDDIQADATVEDLYSIYGYNQSAVWKIYSYLPDGFANLYMEAATDNAYATDIADKSHFFNMGNWSQFYNPDDVFKHYFEGIYLANLYLENRDKVNLEPIKNKVTGTDSTSYFNAEKNVTFMKGEVLFLKAFFYFELVKRYGGVPILEHSFEFSDKQSWSQVKRSTLNSTLKYIIELCDEAATIIPKDVSSNSWYEKGRVTYGAIMALRAETMLYGASPTYKDAGSKVTWEDAARALHRVIALKTYHLDPSYSNLFGENNSSSPEFIFYRRYGKTNSLEYNNFPIVFQNSNGKSITPTQNLVDEFEVVQRNGSGNITSSRMFDWNNPGDSANPYKDRDPRFYDIVIYNNALFSSNYIETYRGGNSGLPKANATKTGYYLSKWVNPSVDLVNGTQTDHTWCYFRYGGILLDYAEAMFNAYGPTADPNGFGKSALDAINEVRRRVKMPSLSASQLDQKRIEHERNVELSFENKRFWDVTRWGEGNIYFNSEIKRIEISKEDSSQFSYSVKDLEDRRFEPKMNWYPIPKDEISKTGWSQNPGWE